MTLATLFSSLIVIFALGVATPYPTKVVAGEASPPAINQRRIVLRLDSTAYPVMSTIMAHIVYENPISDPWTLYRPENSVGVTIRSTPLEWETDPFYGHKGGMGFVLGKYRTSTRVLPNGAQISEVEAPEMKEMRIPPMSRHSFTVRYSHGREDSLVAGGRLLVVKDDYAKLKSNVFKFWMVMTRGSVDALLADVADTRIDPPDRNSRADWLERLRPDLRLQMGYGDATGEKRAAMEADRQTKIAEFRSWWTAGRDTPEMRRFLEEFNVNEGVPLEVVRELEARPADRRMSATPERSATAPDDSSREEPALAVSDLVAPAAPSTDAPNPPSSGRAWKGVGWFAAIGLVTMLIAVAARRLRRASTT